MTGSPRPWRREGGGPRVAFAPFQLPRRKPGRRGSVSVLFQSSSRTRRRTAEEAFAAARLHPLRAVVTQPPTRNANDRACYIGARCDTYIHIRSIYIYGRRWSRKSTRRRRPRGQQSGNNARKSWDDPRPVHDDELPGESESLRNESFHESVPSWILTRVLPRDINKSERRSVGDLPLTCGYDSHGEHDGFNIDVYLVCNVTL